MKSLKPVFLSLIMAIAFAGFFTVSSFAADEEMTTIQGNVICLIPDYENGTVKPVIASGPCDGMPPHQHIVVTKDTVYSLQGLQDGLMKVQQNPQKTDVKIAGKVQGSEQTGWILFVE